MPLYCYENPETGEILEVRRPVEDRNKPIVYTRTRNIPDSINIVGFGPTPEQDHDAGIMRGYYRQEQLQGSRWRSEYTKEQIKRAWSEP